MSLLSSGLVGFVRVYQWTVRPMIGPNCRFWPSCSEYAVEALRGHGALRGSGLAARRILRCNPWHPGGYDPVPPCDCADYAPGGAFPAAATLNIPPDADGDRRPRQVAGFARQLEAAGPNPKAL